MKRKAYLLRATAAASMLGLCMTSGAGLLLFASPAAADVTGYQTGYSYHQGLANGSGGALESAGDSTSGSSAASTNIVSQSVAPSTGVSTNTVTPPASTYSNAATQAVTPSVTTAAPAETTGAVAPSAMASVFEGITPTAWAVIALALIVIVIAGIWTSAESARRSRISTRTTYRRAF